MLCACFLYMTGVFSEIFRQEKTLKVALIKALSKELVLSLKLVKYFGLIEE